MESAHSNLAKNMNQEICSTEGTKIGSNQNPSFSFSTVVRIPPDFKIVSTSTPQMVYRLDKLCMSKETCEKIIQVEEQGETIGCMPVKLRALKICGYIPIFLNIEVQTTAGHYSFDHLSDPLFLSVNDMITINEVLKYSVADLPHYVIDDQHVKLQNLHVTSLEVENDYFARITGRFQLLYG
ncbi:hypothetical protein COK81_13480 [Bacillus thuringiensis]|uniref:Uncharacterized protein n=1 Tax=Bacillus thuringiensis TaxID=1428 RepID=A0A9X7B0H2_BACTU|nr:hypothetical protein [Bacillus thuringiensis]PFT93960.1 hypothetical protein COK81_13480 [Bacillus thuringiensis]HEQ3529398.1 hypothetical protein [Bacillus cereus]